MKAFVHGAIAENVAVEAAEVLPVGGKPAAEELLSADAARMPLTRALLHIVALRWCTAGDLDACARERASMYDMPRLMRCFPPRTPVIPQHVKPCAPTCERKRSHMLQGLPSILLS